MASSNAEDSRQVSNQSLQIPRRLSEGMMAQIDRRASKNHQGWECVQHLLRGLGEPQGASGKNKRWGQGPLRGQAVPFLRKRTIF